MIWEQTRLPPAEFLHHLLQKWEVLIQVTKEKIIAENSQPCLYLSGATFHSATFGFHLEIIITKTKILIFLSKFCLLFSHQSLLLTVFITHSCVP